MNRMTVLSNCTISRHCARTVMTAEITAVFFDDSQTDNVQDEPFIYRPQRSCGQGNVFTGVCLSTGGEGVCLSACWDAIPPRDQGDPPPPDHSDTPPDQADPPREADSSIRSTSGRYASYWNAFLFSDC